VAALAGPAVVMDGLRWGGVLHYGTQNASLIGMMVARANLKALTPAVYEHLEAMGQRLEDGLSDVLRRRGVPGRVQRVGGMLQIFFGTDQPIDDYRQFCRHVDRTFFQHFAWELLRRGVYLSPAASLHSVLSAAHSAEDIDRVVEAADGALETLGSKVRP